MSDDEKVNNLLILIEQEKKKDKPDKRQMRHWFNKIVQLKEDWRTVNNADGCSPFQMHTSVRTWESEENDGKVL